MEKLSEPGEADLVVTNMSMDAEFLLYLQKEERDILENLDV